MHGTTFVSYSQFAVAVNLRGRGLSQSSRSCYSETAPFQDSKQSQIHLHGFSSAIATTETSPGLGGYATCRFLVLADGLLERLGWTLVNEEMYEKVTIIYDVEVALVGSAASFSLYRY